jgi:hypothetical protein
MARFDERVNVSVCKCKLLYYSPAFFLCLCFSSD